MSWKARFHSPVTAGIVWRYRAALYLARRVVAESSCSPYHPCRVYLASPHAVSHLLDTRLDNQTFGVILPGDWDIEAIPIEMTRVGRGLRQRFAEGRPWSETDLNPDSADALDRRRGKYAGQVKDFEAHTAYLEDLWRRLQTYGYLGHRELGEPLESVMTACVGRDGRLVRNKGGLHRLVMAQLLGLERVPVRIIAVHPKFADTNSVNLIPDR